MINKMNIWIIPISGGRFIIQCASIINLLENENKPDIIFSTSGGNLSAYVSMAGGWTSSGVMRLCERISSSLIFESWSSLDLLGFIKGFFSGNLYKNGPGVTKFIKKYFNNESIKDVEIWTGCFNKEENKTSFFCNLSKEESFLNFDNNDSIYRTLEPFYANGDIDLISDYIIASASVPVIVNEKKINGKNYVDGGLGGASPFSFFHKILSKKLKKEKNQCTLLMLIVWI